MLKKLQWSAGLLLFFFVLPVIAGQLPFNKQASTPIEQEEEKRQVVYAANNSDKESTMDSTLETTLETTLESTKDPFQVLILFTHSHETYEPMVQKVSGKVASYDGLTNIYKLKDSVTENFQSNGLQTDVLDVDVMELLKKEGKDMGYAYSTVRPYLANRLKEQSYDLVLDLHRDGISKKASTVSYNNETYAKIALVVGEEHPNFRWNTAYADSLSTALNKLIPNISRGVISKDGEGGNGLYNQDLAKEMIIVELGGVENTEEEINRTIAILGKAISNAFDSDTVN
ncbi:stage II sporulation protein P [Lysinibacillus sp. NPDC097287]|uniref:stage II sporulation protein P n=1 Tax=Lysinibacillus sp. NPDC097287 TaxID=3364144 RepID=UPI003815BC83